MSKVLTQKEYEELSKKAPTSSVKIDEEKPVEAIPTLAPSSNLAYCLMYPDNPSENYHNGVYFVDDKTQVEIINGTVWTESKEVCEKLVQQGFLFLYIKEKKDEQ